MSQMPEAILRAIDSTKSYTNEIRAISATIIENQGWKADLQRNTNKENWPNIYMIGRCVKLFSVFAYCILEEDHIEYDIGRGRHIRFHYDYDTGTFLEDFNFLTQTSLFTYEKHSENFEIVAYVTFPNGVKPRWPSGLSWFDSLPNGGKLYIVNFNDIETQNTVRFRYNYNSGEFEEVEDSNSTNRSLFTDESK